MGFHRKAENLLPQPSPAPFFLFPLVERMEPANFLSLREATAQETVAGLQMARHVAGEFRREVYPLQQHSDRILFRGKRPDTI